MTELSETPIPETPGLAWGPYSPVEGQTEEQVASPSELVQVEAQQAAPVQATQPTQTPVTQAQALMTPQTVQVPQTSAIDPNAKIVETLAMIAEKISAPAQVAPVQAEPTPAEIADVFMSNVQAAKEMLERAGLAPTAENYASVRTQLLIDKTRWEADQKVSRLESLIEKQARMMEEMYANQRLASLDLSAIPEAAREDLRPLVQDLVKRGMEPAQAVKTIQTRLGGLLARLAPAPQPTQVAARPQSTPGQIAASTLQPQQPRDAAGRFQGMSPAQRLAAMDAAFGIY